MERSMPDVQSTPREAPARVTLAENDPALAPGDGAPSEARVPDNGERNRADGLGNGQVNRADGPGNGEPGSPEAPGGTRMSQPGALRDVAPSSADAGRDVGHDLPEPRLEDLRRLLDLTARLAGALDLDAAIDEVLRSS